MTNYNEILDDTIERIDASNIEQLEAMMRHVIEVENIYKNVLINKIDKKYQFGFSGLTVSNSLEEIIKEYERVYNDGKRFKKVRFLQ